MGFPASGVVYLREGIPEEYMEYILDHEILHIIIYNVFLNQKSNSGNAEKAKEVCDIIDRPIWHKTYSEIWGLDGDEFLNWMRRTAAKAYLEKILRRIKNVFSNKGKGS